jgi:predicted transcriptional regulator
MGVKHEAIEVDSATAATLKERAAGRGVSVAELVAELLPFAANAESVAELDLRWARIEGGEATVPHAEVESWLRTWGTKDFRAWNER